MKNSFSQRINSVKRMFKEKIKQKKRLSEVKNLRIKKYVFNASIMLKSMTMKNEIMKDVKEISRKFLKKRLIKKDTAALISKDK